MTFIFANSRISPCYRKVITEQLAHLSSRLVPLIAPARLRAVMIPVFERRYGDMLEIKSESMRQRQPEEVVLELAIYPETAARVERMPIDQRAYARYYL